MGRAKDEVAEAVRGGNDIIALAQDTLSRLQGGSITPDEAHAETRIFAVMHKIIATQIEHAKATSRLKAGSDVLPDYKLGD